MNEKPYTFQEQEETYINKKNCSKIKSKIAAKLI